MLTGQEDVIDTDLQADNSELDNEQEPSNDDNSDDIENEPESDDESDAGTSRFANIEEATKAHAELQKKLGLQSNELGELRKQVAETEKLRQQIQDMQLQEANDKGFDSIYEYNNSKALANFTADKYAEHINECDFPDEMKKLLEAYRNEPTEELLDAIESQFSLKTIKDVSGDTKLFKNQQNEVFAQEIRESAKTYLRENVGKYKDEFNNPAFAALYGEAFRAYGCDLNTDKFVQLMRSYANEVLKANAIKLGIDKENFEDTDEIAGLSTGSVVNSKGKSLLSMSNSELDKRLDELI